ncbi:hypothetical protein MNB_SUP05-SYMBIONT-5-774 [hydrothermal vent metagenome]|uniref:Uncharacterized protein n=1 Tax=hydrothermal vent metagenome TaxID=652676 RepID=A0A1W1E4H5_9ZZZZ
MKKNIMSKIAVASVVLGVSSVSTAAGVGSFIGEVIGAAVGTGAEKVIDSTNVLMGGIQSGGKMDINSDVTTGDVLTGGKNNKLTVGSVRGLKSKNNMVIKNKVKTGDIISLGEGNDVSIGGIGK